jgi:hypothetical protein
MPTVNCPITISSPAPDEQFLALGGKPNMVCGMDCQVVHGEPGQIAQFRCPVGHQFFAVIESEAASPRA